MMQTELKRAREIFLAAVAKANPEEREAYLREACSDPELRRQVEALLNKPEEAGNFLESSSLDPARTVDSQPGQSEQGKPDDAVALEDAGSRIGPYKLLQKLGEGGMGTVWIAEQAQPVKRRVALKVIKPGMDSAQIIRRFEAERQALALMDHTHIAKVLDAGTTAGGRPFFVMELVKGVPFTKYGDEMHLSVRQRLELFVPVCQAVQHAHTKGIIHRDLKPSNVLVTLQDDKAVPKIIDFGVAKALHQRLTDQSLYTEIGAIVGTLEYMSPEQAELSPLDIDTRADVYALGVLLYELLTGSTPLDRKRLKEVGYAELLRLIRQKEPPRPSTRLVQSQESLAILAEQRRTEPAKLTREVRGELDWIVMKCLEKDRTRRYETANSLARDIERYLHDEPVEACPPSAGYRLRKFLRRNKGPVSAIGVAVLGLIVAAGALWYSAERRAGMVRTIEQGQQRIDELGKAIEQKRAEIDQLENTRQKGEERFRRLIYATNMREVLAAWETDNIARVRELLEQAKPGAGEKDLRGFEWHYWGRLSHAEIRTVELGSTDPLNMTFSPDGTRFAAVIRTSIPNKASSVKWGVRVWDTASTKELYTLEGVANSIARLAFSPDGKHLAAVVNSRQVKVWDAATGKPSCTLPSSGSVSEVMFAHDGKRLAGVVRSTEDGKEKEAVQVWETGTGKELATCVVYSGAGEKASLKGKVTFSPDGKRLAGIIEPAKGVERAVVKVWDAESGTERATWSVASGANEPVLVNLNLFQANVTFSPDGKRVAAPVLLFDADAWKTLVGRVQSPQAMHDMSRALNTAMGGVRVWDAVTRKELFTLKGLAASSIAVTFSPNGKRLFAVDGTTGNLKVWHADTGKECSGQGGSVGSGNPLGIRPRLTLSDPGLVNSPDGKLVTAYGLGTVKVWDASNGELRLNLKGHMGGITRVAFSPDGKRIYSAGTDETMKVWNAPASGEPASFEGSLTLRLSPDGQRLAELFVPSLDAHKNPPKGAAILLGVRVWDTATWKELCTGKVAATLGHAYSFDGQRLAGFVMRTGKGMVEKGTEQSDVKVWDTETGKEPLTFEAPVHRVFPNLTFSPDGRRLASAVGEQVRVWDANTGKEMWAFPAAVMPTGLWSGFPLTFSPDGKRLAGVVTTIGKDQERREVKVWDAETGKELTTYPVAGRFIGNLTFSSDGQLLAAASTTGDVFKPWNSVTEVRVWEAATGKERLVLKGHTGMVGLVAFSRDGSRIATTTGFSSGQTENEVKVWDAATGAELLTLKAPFYTPSSMAFSSDGNRLLLVGQKASMTGPTVKVWDATPRAEGRSVPGMPH
jgi:WD40 repeat protein/serine/threonine protein kinase